MKHLGTLLLLAATLAQGQTDEIITSGLAPIGTNPVGRTAYNIIRETIIVTNVTGEAMVERYEPAECPDYNPGSPYHCAVYHCQAVYSKTDRLETEIVLERDQVRMEVDGKEHTQVISEKELSRRTRTIIQVKTLSVLTNEWTDVLKSQDILWSTNNIITGTTTNTVWRLE